MSDDSNFSHKEPCPKCGSRDNLARYDDGHAYCFGCEYYEPGEGQKTSHPTGKERRVRDLIAPGETAGWPSRSISEEDAERWGFTRSTLGDEAVRVFNYRDETGKLVAQKVRFKSKDFRTFGDITNRLYGRNLWRDAGKMVVVTEGEIDAISVSKMQGHKWPVVSIPNGAPGAKKALAANMEWLDQFENVILMFDMDEPGRDAAIECATLFKPGKAKIASLPLKDANEMLNAGRGKEIIDAIWGAKDYRPDGIVTLADVREAVLNPPALGLSWWPDRLTELTYGRRYGEIYAFGAGTGVGKTDWLAQQIVHDIRELNEPVGAFFLETAPTELVKRIAGKVAGRRFHVPDGSWTVEELTSTIDELEGAGKLFLYDSFGATDWDRIKSTIRYLHHSEGVRLFYLDHLTALAAAETDERTALERIMAEMGSLVKELGIIIHLVSHLATPDGKPHEEGGRVMIRHFKGSRSIGFWCHYMFGLERDQQHEDPNLRTVTTFRVLKDRFVGTATGEVFFMGYNRDEGRLTELQQDPFNDEADFVSAASDFGDETGTDDPF